MKDRTPRMIPPIGRGRQKQHLFRMAIVDVMEKNAEGETTSQSKDQNRTEQEILRRFWISGVTFAEWGLASVGVDPQVKFTYQLRFYNSNGKHSLNKK